MIPWDPPVNRETDNYQQTNNGCRVCNSEKGTPIEWMMKIDQDLKQNK